MRSQTPIFVTILLAFLAFEPAHAQGKGLFDRRPVFAHFTLSDGGQERNDLAYRERATPL